MADDAPFPRGVELRHLRYFVVVAEELHFGRAAKRLSIAQPPLSQQIARLETLVGYPLLERRPRVALTEPGRVLLAAARRTLQSVAHGVDATRRAGRGETGMLTVGFAASAMLTALPEVFRAYRSRFPGVELRLREMSTSAQVEALRVGGIDAGFLREPAEHPDVLAEPVLREPFVAALPPEHPLPDDFHERLQDRRGLLAPAAEGDGGGLARGLQAVVGDAAPPQPLKRCGDQ